MTNEELKFIEDNIANFETVKVGYVKNIQLPVLYEYEKLYHKYIDPTYVLTAWCSNCCFLMIERLANFYYQYKKLHIDDNLNIIVDDLPFVDYPEVELPKKRGRKKRN
jgi:hypothetical protein